MYIVQREQSIKYAWDNVSSEKKLLVVSIGGEERVVDMLRIGSQEPLLCTNRNQMPCYMDIQVLAEGPVIILRISPISHLEIQRSGSRRSNPEPIKPCNVSIFWLFLEITIKGKEPHRAIRSKRATRRNRSVHYQP